MEYGRIPYTGLREKDFTFDLSMPQLYLSGIPAKNPILRWGFPQWGRKEWLGQFYPKGTKDAQFLEYYVQHFNAVELNATHYGMPETAQILNWESKVKGMDFLFCPKLSNEISHYGNLDQKEALLAIFTQRVKGFGEQLGPVLFQLSDRFAPRRQRELESFLRHVTIPTFLELRHEEWFKPSILRPFLGDLHQRKIGAVITDSPGFRDRIIQQLTVPAAYIRFCAEGDQPLDDFRLQQWKLQIKSWLDQGMERCYFFLHLYKHGNALGFANKVKEALEPLFPS